MRITTALLVLAMSAFFSGYWAHDAMIKFIRDDAYAPLFVLVSVMFLVATGLWIRRIARQIDQPIK